MDLAMPQPIHYSHLISFDFSPEAILQRPELAAHVAGISAQWNEIEARTAAFLAALLGGEARTGISIFFAITNDGAKRAAIDAISGLKLWPEQREEFQKILRAINERYGERNHAIHGAWGVSPLYPDALLWADIRETVLLHVELMDERNAPASKKLRLDFQKKIRVWKKQDFTNIIERLKLEYSKLFDFTRPFIDDALFMANLKSLDPAREPHPWSRARPDPSESESGQQ